MSTSYDAIVLGLGGMGSATAYQLALRGRRVLGLERFTPAHDKGSSHGQSRIIRQAYYEDPAYVPLLLRAYELWDQIERASGQQLFLHTGGIMLGSPESHVMQGSIRSAREHGLPHEILGADEIHRRYPVFTPAPHEIALFEPTSGVLRPEDCIRAHLARAAAHGADLHFEEPALSWQADGEGVRVVTAAGSYTAARLIITAGTWAPELLRDLGLPLHAERRVMYWFEPAGGHAPFQPDRFPIYIWEVEDGHSFYGFPSLGGAPGGVKVALHTVPDDICTPETIDRGIRPHEIARMRQYLAGRVPTLSQGQFVAALTCMYTLTPDWHFVITPHPQHPQVIVSSTCAGHGFKFASVIGEILADLAADGATRHPIGLFDPARFNSGQPLTSAI